MAENLITASELTSYAPDLNLDAYDSTTVSGMISRASARLAGMANVDGFFTANVTAETDRLRINSSGDMIISFRRRPVAAGAVSTVALRTVDVNQSLTLTDSTGGSIYWIPGGGGYMVYPSNFIISHGYGLITARNANLHYEVSYVGGYATDVANIPPDLKEAVTLLIRDALYSNDGLRGFSQGSYSEQRSTFPNTHKSVFEARAIDILNAGNYIRMVV